MTRHEVFPQGARDRIEILEEENRQLRATIAKLVGGDDTETARLTLSLTEAEATIFTLLVRCGVATYGQIQSAIYDVDRLDMINDVGEAIRSHVKRIRKKLRPLGIDFTTIYSLGFEMDEVCRAKARLMLARAA